MKKCIIVSIFLLGCFAGFTQSFDPSYQPITSHSILQDKNFYLFTLMEQLPEVKKVIAEDEVLQSMLQKQKELMARAADSCGEDSQCHYQLFYWSAEEIDKVEDRLAHLYQQYEAIKNMVNEHMRVSGRFNLFANESDKVLLQKAWKQAASSLNRIFEVYILGHEPRYPNIDSASFNTDFFVYHRIIDIKVNLMQLQQGHYQLFFQPSVDLALNLLQFNGREDAARFEPLQQGENFSAWQHVAEINWQEYPYSLILILGSAPDVPDMPLDPMADLRLQLGLELYRKGMAPFILVSGGFVHPIRTPYNEAFEMKKALMEQYGVPEKHIFIDPYARHTTTNLRNASRTIFTYGLPADKKAIVLTDHYHSSYVASQRYRERCMTELGYLPVELGKRFNKFALEFTPLKVSLHRDAMDPLDP